MPYVGQGLWPLVLVLLAGLKLCVETWADAALIVCRCEGYIAVVGVVPVPYPLCSNAYLLLIQTVSECAESYVCYSVQASLHTARVLKLLIPALTFGCHLPMQVRLRLRKECDGWVRCCVNASSLYCLRQTARDVVHKAH